MKNIKITKKQKYIIWGGGLLLVSIAIAVPLIVQSTKKNTTSFDLAIIKNQMQMATKSKATLEDTKVAIVKMYQNGTTQNLSPQAKKAAQVLAQYIYKNKTKQKFDFALGKDHQDQQLLLLTIVNNLAKPKDDASLQKAIPQVPIYTQKQHDLSSVNQLQWVTKALQKAKFGILFWIYQNRLSGQEAIHGIALAPSPIIAINFQRVKTPHEQLQDQAWAKTMQVIHKLTSSQLEIHVDAQQLPSQTKITTRAIVLAIQNIISNRDVVHIAAQKLIKEDNIEVQLDDKHGKINITIKNYGHDKIIAIFGFKATGTPLEVAQAKIKVAKDGASLPTKLNQVFHGQTPTASDVNAPAKNGVTFRFRLATAINDWGTSILTYEVNANPQVEGATTKEVTFVVSGFETQVQAIDRISKLAQEAIQKLVASDFIIGIDKAQIASVGAPNKAHVISDIKKQINNKDAKALILPSDIAITSNNTTQTIIIVINHHGPTKTITIAGFKTIKDYLDQILTALPSSDGALVIPNDITSSQFDAYVQAMGNVLNEKGEVVMNKFADQHRAKITSLTISNSFTTISPWFKDFNKITSLHIPNSVTIIKNLAFNRSPLTTLSLGNHLQTIEDNAFNKALLTSLRIPNSVTTIGIGAFFSSPLTTLSLGDQLQTIGEYAFTSALLTSLRIPNAVTIIGNFAFVSSVLTTLSLGDQLQTIGASAFYSAELGTLHIPASVTAIGAGAFGSSPLTTINIFQGVTLGKDVFKDPKIIKWIPKPA